VLREVGVENIDAVGAEMGSTCSVVVPIRESGVVCNDLPCTCAQFVRTK
jgi:hypothetical protein